MSTEDGARHFLSMFSDPQAVARYADGPRRYVPGLADLHRMTGILLAERAPRDARVLVLGAGGGLELKALAEAWPDWSFVGVDPSGPSCSWPSVHSARSARVSSLCRVRSRMRRLGRSTRRRVS